MVGPLLLWFLSWGPRCLQDANGRNIDIYWILYEYCKKVTTKYFLWSLSAEISWAAFHWFSVWGGFGSVLRLCMTSEMQNKDTCEKEEKQRATVLASGRKTLHTGRGETRFKVKRPVLRTRLHCPLFKQESAASMSLNKSIVDFLRSIPHFSIFTLQTDVNFWDFCPLKCPKFCLYNVYMVKYGHFLSQNSKASFQQITFWAKHNTSKLLKHKLSWWKVANISC